jgi:hypothetical protein
MQKRTLNGSSILSAPAILVHGRSRNLAYPMKMLVYAERMLSPWLDEGINTKNPLPRKNSTSMSL